MQPRQRLRQPRLPALRPAGRRRQRARLVRRLVRPRRAAGWDVGRERVLAVLDVEDRLLHAVTCGERVPDRRVEEEQVEETRLLFLLALGHPASGHFAQHLEQRLVARLVALNTIEAGAVPALELLQALLVELRRLVVRLGRDLAVEQHLFEDLGVLRSDELPDAKETRIGGDRVRSAPAARRELVKVVAGVGALVQAAQQVAGGQHALARVAHAIAAASGRLAVARAVWQTRRVAWSLAGLAGTGRQGLVPAGAIVGETVLCACEQADEDGGQEEEDEGKEQQRLLQWSQVLWLGERGDDRAELVREALEEPASLALSLSVIVARDGGSLVDVVGFVVSHAVRVVRRHPDGPAVGSRGGRHRV